MRGHRRGPLAGRLLAVLTLIATSGLARPAEAGNRLANRLFVFTAENDSGRAANGWYIYLANVRRAQIDLTASDSPTLNNIRINENTPGAAGITIFFENANQSVANGATTSFGLMIRNTEAALRVGVTGFRDRAGPTGRPITEVRGPGFMVRGDPIYNILNNDDTPQDFEIQNLQFLVNSPQLPDMFAPLDFSNSYGFGPATFNVSMTTADPMSSDFNLPPVDNGNWLYSRGQFLQDGVEVARFVEGVSYQAVPEPATIFSAGVGIACVVLGWRWRRARARIVPAD